MNLSKFWVVGTSLAISWLASGAHATNPQTSGDKSSGPGKDHRVIVGKSGLKFEPSTLSAKKGDTVTFVFYQTGHTVTQTRFDNPCAGYKPPSPHFCTSSTPSSGSSPYPTSGYPDSGAQPGSSTHSSDLTNANAGLDTANGSSLPPEQSSTANAQSPPEKQSTAIPNVVSTPAVTSGSQDVTKAAANTSYGSNKPDCPCSTTPPNYPTTSSPTSSPPGTQTCGAKCIEVSGSCQISTDCSVQAKSPPDTKCKMKGGQCTKCGKNKRRRKRAKRSSKTGRKSRRRARRNLEESDFTDENASGSHTRASATPLPGAPLNASLTSWQRDDPSGQNSYKDSGAGLDSGVVNVDEASKASGISWKITIEDDGKPLWFMSAAQNECSSGMLFAINPPSSGAKTYDAFVKAAQSSHCPQAYPSSPNLKGDGTSASSPPAKCAQSGGGQAGQNGGGQAGQNGGGQAGQSGGGQAGQSGGGQAGQSGGGQAGQSGGGQSEQSGGGKSEESGGGQSEQGGESDSGQSGGGNDDKSGGGKSNWPSQKDSETPGQKTSDPPVQNPSDPPVQKRPDTSNTSERPSPYPTGYPGGGNYSEPSQTPKTQTSSGSQPPPVPEYTNNTSPKPPGSTNPPVISSTGNSRGKPFLLSTPARVIYSIMFLSGIVVLI